jgi:hypothetical protein
MTECEVIDWFMRWAAEYVKFKGPTWDRDGRRIDAHPRWRVYKLCELLGYNNRGNGGKAYCHRLAQGERPQVGWVDEAFVRLALLEPR